ncbi:MAG: DUF448 domain-containing protein [Alphaproteobacteria bacterium]|nr:DUF448 domain-containing protein [Alphaproteobacteria bacterium]
MTAHSNSTRGTTSDAGLSTLAHDGDGLSSDKPPAGQAHVGKSHRARERRCIATGIFESPDRLIRFVVGPDNVLVADIDRKLPGRGAYIAPETAALERALARNLFTKAFGCPVKLPEGVDVVSLGADLEQALRRRLAAAAGLARRAGDLVVGLEKIDRMPLGRLALIFSASDAGDRSRRLAEKIAVRHGASISRQLPSAALSAAIGLDGVKYAGVKHGHCAPGAMCDAERLGRFAPCALEIGDLDVAALSPTIFAVGGDVN